MNKARIIRVQSPEFFSIPEVLSELEKVEGFSEGFYVQSLKDSLRQNPEGFYVLAVVSLEGKVVGFTINTIPQLFDYTFILQAWADPVGCPKEITSEVWEMNKRWTKLVGKKQIRMQTSRAGAVWARAYGFEESAVEMKLVLNKVKEEVENGGWKSETGVVVESSATVNSGSPGETD